MFLITVIIFIMGIKIQLSPSPKYTSLFFLLLLELHSTPINHFVKVQTLEGGIRCSFLYNHFMCKVIASFSFQFKKKHAVDSQQELYIYHFTFIPISISEKFLQPIRYHVRLGGGEYSAST